MHLRKNSRVRVGPTKNSSQTLGRRHHCKFTENRQVAGGEMMFECKKFRIEVWQCRSGNYHVVIQPIQYLGREEFKAWIRLCKRNFMALVSRRPWRFENVFSSRVEAVALARKLTAQLGEPCFFDRTKKQLQIVTPKEGDMFEQEG